MQPTGTADERSLFSKVLRHYELAKEDLQVRIRDFDKKDILFRSHIVEGSWPYRAMVFDPIVFTVLYEKTSRILANKPKGRMIPREGGDQLGAKINNELLSFQWDDNERADGMTMLAKWALMDLNARKYGAAFGLVNWKYQTKENLKDKKRTIQFDGPNFKPLANRDCLPNPSYSTIKNWFDVRDYVTLQDLMDTNDAARSKPIYKNLDILRRMLRNEIAEGGDSREANYVAKNKSLKGLTDYLGKDEVYKVIEIVTEYGEDRWVTFAPRHGVIIRDIPNPYDHGQIPIVQLKYYPIDDDIYGLSEIEPVEKLQKAINALLNQYLDGINMSLYPIVKVRSTGGAVQMHTLEFGPGKKWLMSDPATDVMSHIQAVAGIQEFATTYRLLKGAMQEGMGETSAAASNLVPGASSKTATEIKDLSVSRSARDNFNLMFLGDSIKKQFTFWHAMNQQFLFSNPKEKQKVIRIVGKDAIKYFQQVGLDGEAMTEDGMDMLSSPEFAGMNIDPHELMTPLHPVQVGNDIVPKFSMEPKGDYGELILEPEDLNGTYDYVVDIESMQIPDKNDMVTAKQQMVEIALNPATSQLLAAQQYQLNAKELLEDFFEQLGSKDADKYFERIQPQQQLPVDQPLNGQIPEQAGGGSAEGVPNDMVNGGDGGVQTPPEAIPNGQAQPGVPRSFGF